MDDEEEYGYHRGQSKADFWDWYRGLGDTDEHIQLLWDDLQAWREDVRGRMANLRLRP